jgi:hypothetical protein
VEELSEHCVEQIELSITLSNVSLVRQDIEVF